jgi:hypothetical protein
MSLTDVFRSFGVDARYIFSKTPMTERKALIDAFRAGHFPVLVNCGTVHLPFGANHSLTTSFAQLFLRKALISLTLTVSLLPGQRALSTSLVR